MTEGITARDTGGYQARVTINGSRRSKTFPTLKAAKAWRSKQLATAADGTWVDPRDLNQPLEDLLEDYLDSLTVRPKSIAVYRHCLGHIPEPRIPVGAIKTSTVAKWQKDVAEKVGIPTANKMVMILRSAFRAAIADELLVRNPATGVKAIVRRTPEREFLTAQELDAVLPFLPGDYQNAAKFLAFTGQRAGDGLTATHDRVDRINRQIFVPNAKSRTSSGHWIPLAEGVADMVLHRAKTPGLLFMNSKGNVIDLSYFNKLLKAACKKAGVDKVISAHSLRHTFASWALSSGCSITAVSQMLGHANVTQTLNTYSHCLPNDFNAVIVKLDQMWEERGRGLVAL